MPVVTPHVPDGLIDLMKALTKSILKERPDNIYQFAVEHFEKLIVERDGSLDKGYEHFQAWEEYFKAEEKLQKSTKIQRSQNKKASKREDLNSYEAKSEDLQTAAASIQRKHFKPRKLSSRKPSETLLAIKEDDGEEAARKEIDEEMRRREWAAFKIQKAFRKFFEKTTNIGSGSKKKMTKQMAALIIQRTLRSLFQQRLLQKAEIFEKVAGAGMVDESLLPVSSMTKLAAPLRQNSDDQHPSIAFGERCTDDNAKQDTLLLGDIDDIKEQDSEDELLGDIASADNSVLSVDQQEIAPVSIERESLTQLLKDEKNREPEKEPGLEKTGGLKESSQEEEIEGDETQPRDAHKSAGVGETSQDSLTAQMPEEFPTTSDVPDSNNTDQVDQASSTNNTIEKESLSQILKNEKNDKTLVLESHESQEAPKVNMEKSAEPDGNDDDTKSQHDEEAIQNIVATASSDGREPLISDIEQPELVPENLIVEQESLAGILKDRKKDKVDNVGTEKIPTAEANHEDVLPSTVYSKREEKNTHMTSGEEKMSKKQIVDLKEAIVDNSAGDNSSLNPEIGSTNQNGASKQPSSGPTLEEVQPMVAVDDSNEEESVSTLNEAALKQPSTEPTLEEDRAVAKGVSTSNEELVPEKLNSEQSKNLVQSDIAESAKDMSILIGEPPEAEKNTAVEPQPVKEVEIQEANQAKSVAENRLSEQKSIEKESLSKLLKEERGNRVQEPTNVSKNESIDGSHTLDEANLKPAEEINGDHFSASKSESEPNQVDPNNSIQIKDSTEMSNNPNEERSEIAEKDSSNSPDEKLKGKSLFVVDTVNLVEQQPTETKTVNGEEKDEENEVHNQIKKPLEISEATHSPAVGAEPSTDDANEKASTQEDHNSHLISENVSPMERSVLDPVPTNPEPFSNQENHEETSGTNVKPDQIKEIPTISVHTADLNMEKSDQLNEKNRKMDETVPSPVSAENLQASANSQTHANLTSKEQPSEHSVSLKNMPEKDSDAKSQNKLAQESQSPEEKFDKDQKLEEKSSPVDVVNDSGQDNPQDENKVPECRETLDKAERVHAPTPVKVDDDINKPSDEAPVTTSDMLLDNSDTANNRKGSVDTVGKSTSLEVKEGPEVDSTIDKSHKESNVHTEVSGAAEKPHKIEDKHPSSTYGENENTPASSQVNQPSEEITTENTSNAIGVETETKKESTLEAIRQSVIENFRDTTNLLEEKLSEKPHEERTNRPDGTETDTNKQKISETTTSTEIGNTEKTDDISQLATLDSTVGVASEPGVSSNVQENDDNGTSLTEPATTSMNASKLEDEGSPKETSKTSELTTQTEQIDTSNNNSEDTWNQESLAESLRDFKIKAQPTGLPDNEVPNQNRHAAEKDELVELSDVTETLIQPLDKSESFNTEVSNDLQSNITDRLSSLPEKSDEFLDSLEPNTANKNVTEVQKDDDGNMSEAELTGLIIENVVNKENEAGNPPQATDNHNVEKGEKVVANHPGKVAESLQNTFNTVESKPLEGDCNANVIGKQLVDPKNDVELIDETDVCKNVPDLKLCDTNSRLDKASDDKEIDTMKSSDSKMRKKRSAPELLDERCFSEEEPEVDLRKIDVVKEDPTSGSTMSDPVPEKVSDIHSLESMKPIVESTEKKEADCPTSIYLDDTVSAKTNDESSDSANEKEGQKNSRPIFEKSEIVESSAKSQRNAHEAVDVSEVNLISSGPMKYDTNAKGAPLPIEELCESTENGKHSIHVVVVTSGHNNEEEISRSVDSHKLHRDKEPQDDESFNNTEFTPKIHESGTRTEKHNAPTEDEHSKEGKREEPATSEPKTNVGTIPLSELTKEQGKYSESANSKENIDKRSEKDEPRLLLDGDTIHKLRQRISSTEPTTSTDNVSDSNILIANEFHISDCSEAFVKQDTVPDINLQSETIQNSCEVNSTKTETTNYDIPDNKIEETLYPLGTEGSVSEAEITKREITDISANFDGQRPSPDSETNSQVILLEKVGFQGVDSEKVSSGDSVRVSSNIESSESSVHKDSLGESNCGKKSENPSDLISMDRTQILVKDKILSDPKGNTTNLTSSGNLTSMHSKEPIETVNNSDATLLNADQSDSKESNYDDNQSNNSTLHKSPSTAIKQRAIDKDSPKAEDQIFDPTESNSDAVNTETVSKDGEQLGSTLPDLNSPSEYKFSQFPTEQQRATDTSHKIIESEDAATEKPPTVSDSKENEKFNSDLPNPIFSDTQNHEALITNSGVPILNSENKISSRNLEDTNSLQTGKEGSNFEKCSSGVSRTDSIDDSDQVEPPQSELQNIPNSENVDNDILEDPMVSEDVGKKSNTGVELRKEAEESRTMQNKLNIPVDEERDADGQSKTELAKQKDTQNTGDTSFEKNTIGMKLSDINLENHSTDNDNALSDSTSDSASPERDNIISATGSVNPNTGITENTRKSSDENFDISSNRRDLVDSKTELRSPDKPLGANNSEQETNEDESQEILSTGIIATESPSNTQEGCSDIEAPIKKLRATDFSTEPNENLQDSLSEKVVQLNMDNNPEEEALKNEKSTPLNPNEKSETVEAPAGQKEISSQLTLPTKPDGSQNDQEKQLSASIKTGDGTKDNLNMLQNKEPHVLTNDNPNVDQESMETITDHCTEENSASVRSGGKSISRRTTLEADDVNTEGQSPQIEATSLQDFDSLERPDPGMDESRSIDNKPTFEETCNKRDESQISTQSPEIAVIQKEPSRNDSSSRSYNDNEVQNPTETPAEQSSSRKENQPDLDVVEDIIEKRIVPSNEKSPAKSLVNGTDDSILMNVENNFPENDPENLKLKAPKNQTDEEKHHENQGSKVSFENKSEEKPKSSETVVNSESGGKSAELKDLKPILAGIQGSSNQDQTDRLLSNKTNKPDEEQGSKTFGLTSGTTADPTQHELKPAEKQDCTNYSSDNSRESPAPDTVVDQDKVYDRYSTTAQRHEPNAVTDPNQSTKDTAEGGETRIEISPDIAIADKATAPDVEDFKNATEIGSTTRKEPVPANPEDTTPSAPIIDEDYDQKTAAEIDRYNKWMILPSSGKASSSGDNLASFTSTPSEDDKTEAGKSPEIQQPAEEPIALKTGSSTPAEDKANSATVSENSKITDEQKEPASNSSGNTAKEKTFSADGPVSGTQENSNPVKENLTNSSESILQKVASDSDSPESKYNIAENVDGQSLADGPSTSAGTVINDESDTINPTPEARINSDTISKLAQNSVINENIEDSIKPVTVQITAEEPGNSQSQDTSTKNLVADQVEHAKGGAKNPKHELEDSSDSNKSKPKGFAFSQGEESGNATNTLPLHSNTNQDENEGKLTVNDSIGQDWITGLEDTFDSNESKPAVNSSGGSNHGTKSENTINTLLLHSDTNQGENVGDLTENRSTGKDLGTLMAEDERNPIEKTSSANEQKQSLHKLPADSMSVSSEQTKPNENVSNDLEMEDVHGSESHLMKSNKDISSYAADHLENILTDTSTSKDYNVKSEDSAYNMSLAQENLSPPNEKETSASKTKDVSLAEAQIIADSDDTALDSEPTKPPENRTISPNNTDDSPTGLVAEAAAKTIQNAFRNHMEHKNHLPATSEVGSSAETQESTEPERKTSMTIVEPNNEHEGRRDSKGIWYVGDEPIIPTVPEKQEGLICAQPFIGVDDSVKDADAKELEILSASEPTNQNETKINLEKSDLHKEDEIHPKLLEDNTTPMCPTDVSESGQSSTVDPIDNRNTDDESKIERDSEHSHSRKLEASADKEDQTGKSSVKEYPIDNGIENADDKPKTEPSSEKLEASTANEVQQSAKVVSDMPASPEAKVMSRIPIRQPSATKSNDDISKRPQNGSEQPLDDNKAIKAQVTAGKASKEINIETLQSELPNPEPAATSKLQPPAPECHPESKGVSNSNQDDSPRSDVENMDISIYGEDSLEAMYYSLKKHELLLDKMHKQASVCKSASKDRLQEVNVSESHENPAGTETLLPLVPIIAEKISKGESEDPIDLAEKVAPIPTRKLSHNDSLREALENPIDLPEAVAPMPVKKLPGEEPENPIGLVEQTAPTPVRKLSYNDSLKKALENPIDLPEDARNEFPRDEPEDPIDLTEDVTPLYERKLSRNDSYSTACFTRPITSATILPRSKTEVDSENPIELSKKRTQQFIQHLHAPSDEKSVSMDELADNEIRRNMLAYSISEADSDYYEPAERTNAILNDFNISTALENTPSTDTDSTIISAVTKIQAGARGFLTRRRLRRASVATTSFSERKPSFGNGAIGESFEDLIDEEDAARRIQKSFRRYRNRKTRQSAPTLRNNITDSSSSKSSNNSSEEIPLKIIDVKLEQKSIALSNISEKSEWGQTKEGVGEPASNAIDSKEKMQEVGISLDGLNLAARRMTLQRGDAVQRNSTGEEESRSTSGNGSHDHPDKVTDSKKKLPRAKSSGTERKRSPSTTDRTVQLDRKRLTTRQRTMPVQIDFEILRVLPKHLRKRIKSADEDGKHKTDF